MELVVFASMAPLSAFLITLVIYFFLFPKRKINEENEQSRELEADSGLEVVYPDQCDGDEGMDPNFNTSQSSVSNQEPVIGSGSHGVGRTRGEHQQICIQTQERKWNFRDGRDFGAMPPIGSAEAEFQNDFIAVFPMRHLEPLPDLSRFTRNIP